MKPAIIQHTEYICRNSMTTGGKGDIMRKEFRKDRE